MFKSSKNKVLEFKHKNNSPLVTSVNRGERNMLRIKNIKERIRIKKIKDINGMEISYDVIEKKN